MRNQIANTISALQELLQSLDLVMERAQAAVAAATAAAQANAYMNSGGYSGGDESSNGTGAGDGSGNSYKGGLDNVYGNPSDPLVTVFDPGGNAVFTDQESRVKQWLSGIDNS